MITNLSIDLSDDQRDALASMIDGKDNTRLATRNEIKAIAQQHLGGMARVAEAATFEDVEDEDMEGAASAAYDDGAPENELYVVDDTDPLSRTMAKPQDPSYIRGWNQVKGK
jgi:hypothetical protein